MGDLSEKGFRPIWADQFWASRSTVDKNVSHCSVSSARTTARKAKPPEDNLKNTLCKEIDHCQVPIGHPWAP